MLPSLTLLAAVSFAPVSGDEQATLLESLSLAELVERLPAREQAALWDPEAQEWRSVPVVAELERRLGEGAVLTDELWRSALLQSGTLRFRSRWPVEVPFAVSIAVPRWLGSRVEIRANPRSPGWTHAIGGGTASFVFCGNAASYEEEQRSYQELGMLSLGLNDLLFDVTVVRGIRPETFSEYLRVKEGRAAAVARGETLPEEPSTVLLWEGSLALAVEGVEHFEDVVPPVASSEAESVLARSLTLSFVEGESAGRRSALLASNVDLAQPEIAATSLVLAIDVLRDGRSRGRTLFFLDEYEDFHERSVVLAGLPAELESDGAERWAWSLRVTGVDVGTFALRRWKESRYAGSFTVGVAELLQRAR